MNSVSPVFTDAEVEHERVIALDQPEYVPIVVLPIALQVLNDGDKDVITKDGQTVPPGALYAVEDWGKCLRFRFTEEERAQIAAGCDLIVTELVFGRPFTPINLQLRQPNERPEF
jgi:hypothetical protein